MSSMISYYSEAASDLGVEFQSQCLGNSLVVQWLRILLPTQGTQVPSLETKITHAAGRLSPCTTVNKYILGFLNSSSWLLTAHRTESSSCAQHSRPRSPLQPQLPDSAPSTASHQPFVPCPSGSLAGLPFLDEILTQFEERTACLRVQQVLGASLSVG